MTQESLDKHPITVALLSATGASGHENTTVSAGLKYGEPLVSMQIEQLRLRGVNHFLVEVDAISGVLVTLADRLQQKNVIIDFVRSPQELAARMEGGLLFVQSEAIMADAGLLEKMLASTKAVLATVDGRDENANFERIDLNTRWSGLAVIDRQTIDGIAALPEGWSISSSLLRQALQNKIAAKALKQDYIQNRQLQHIISETDYHHFTSSLLDRRASQTKGAVESRIIGPLAKYLAPRIWRSNSGQKVIDGVTLGSALMCFAAGYTGFGIFASAMALLAITGITISNIIQINDITFFPDL